MPSTCSSPTTTASAGCSPSSRSANENDDTDTMSAAALKIFEDLEVHMTIEEEIFYPTVRDTNDDISETVDEGVQEHHVAKVAHGRDQAAARRQRRVGRQDQVLSENVEHHTEEEEKELFPPLRNSPTRRVGGASAEQFEARKSQLGAPVLADKIDLTKEELLELAQEQQIPGRSSMSQEELAATVAPA